MIAPIDPKSEKKPADPEPTPTLPVPAPDQPRIMDPSLEVPEGIEPTTPGMAAMEVLEKFLAAKTLAERLPMMETQTPEAELANSCLAGPLPTTSLSYGKAKACTVMLRWNADDNPAMPYLEALTIKALDWNP